MTTKDVTAHGVELTGRHARRHRRQHGVPGFGHDLASALETGQILVIVDRHRPTRYLSLQSGSVSRRPKTALSSAYKAAMAANNTTLTIGFHSAMRVAAR